MKRVEAATLEEAYAIAASQLSCSVTDLECEVVQYPSKGIFGLLKKDAIIVATCKADKKSVSKNTAKKEKKPTEPTVLKTRTTTEKTKTEKPEVKVEKSEKPIASSTSIEKKINEKDAVLDSFFVGTSAIAASDSASDSAKASESVSDSASDSESLSESENVVYDELALLIENELKSLLFNSCFDIDVVEVDVRDNTALIFIDGEDAALLIGKEGYRYNALSYMIFNWLHTKYELFIKLEIAEFLTSQQEMIRSYIQPLIVKIEKDGKGRTRPMDGILVQIALEQLREAFPNKYVAAKNSRDGRKFIVINEFNKKTP